MYTSVTTRCVLAVGWLIFSIARASPVSAAEQDASTVTAKITSVDGTATTTDPAPATLTASSASSATDASLTTTSTSTSSGAAPTSTGGGAFQICHNLKGAFAPFCKPDNGSSVYVDQTYYVTWDTKYFPGSNNSVFVQANYVNASGGGVQAFQSSLTNNNAGFIAWTIDKAWLKGMHSNNVTLFITSTDSTVASSVRGPTLMVTTSPSPEPYRQPKAKSPNGASLFIALPVVLAFILLCLFGTCYWNYKHRTIGLGNVMGRRNGYGSGQSRSQRLGLGRKSKKDQGILLREQELTSEGQYKDIPTRTEDPAMHFRDEMSWEDGDQFRDEARWHAASRL
ncbi:hypothetical protein CJF30_00002061 [Rutstroemia sp. NJR-2017a BBW]|nr:hypothetical protein CJF30_00002061 [Rutstroemia sp. NJR-2017a BBW]